VHESGLNARRRETGEATQVGDLYRRSRSRRSSDQAHAAGSAAPSDLTVYPYDSLGGAENIVSRRRSRRGPASRTGRRKSRWSRSSGRVPSGSTTPPLIRFNISGSMFSAAPGGAVLYLEDRVERLTRMPRPDGAPRPGSAPESKFAARRSTGSARGTSRQVGSEELIGHVPSGSVDHGGNESRPA
jgi:hypothetical protein